MPTRTFQTIFEKNLIAIFLLSSLLTCLIDAGVMSDETSGESGTLLFQSGFESGVTIPPPLIAGKQWWRQIDGSDASGYRWTADLPEQSPSIFQYLVPQEANLDEYVETRIDRVVGPHGVGTNALYLAVKSYDPAGFGRGWLARNQYNLYTLPAFKQAYVRYYLKLQPDLETLMPVGQSAWRNLMAWRETGDDYVVSIFVERLPHINELFWSVEARLGVSGDAPKDWKLFNTDVPVPIGQWFLLEVFWKQNPTDGRVWVAVDGQPIADYSGRTQLNSELSRWNLFKVYTGPASLDKGAAYQWIDDVQIYTDIPQVIGKPGKPIYDDPTD